MIHALCRPIMLLGAGGRRYWTAFFTSACFMFVTVINGRRLVRMIAPSRMRAHVRNDQYAESIGGVGCLPNSGRHAATNRAVQQAWAAPGSLIVWPPRLASRRTRCPLISIACAKPD
jgi:hypothetical protein